MRYIKICFLFGVFISCSNESTNINSDEDVKSGGATSVSGSFIKIFEQPAANLNSDEIKKHFQSDAAFGAIFVSAPSILQGGLGPIFNQNSCESCHLSNGRSPFPDQSNDLKGLLIRLSVPGVTNTGAPIPVPDFGGQLQSKSIIGSQKEASVSITRVESIVQFFDGLKVSLSKPLYSLYDAYKPLPPNVLVSPRIASPIFGLGLLEAISQSDILKNEDITDSNKDGISGKANWVWDVQSGTQKLGRFGWKASQPSLLQQTAAAYNNDMGITSYLFKEESFKGQVQDDKLFDDPEIDSSTLEITTFYTQSLCVPERRNYESAEVRRGKLIFHEIQCASCHIPSFTTSIHELSFLSNQKIFPYTDLLLHDMGEGLADNRPDFLANGLEWRTPPLWGIGLTKIVGGFTHFMHDGRARNLTEAILWHGGEAEKSKNDFLKLDESKRIALIKYLESL